MLIRKAADRGTFENHWLKAKYSFSFNNYYDEKWSGFGRMLVFNHDLVQVSRGFAPHPHDNMEIVTYVLKGRVAHEDSMGNKVEVRAGEVQRMSAGTGIVHSEKNPSADEVLELFQIWFEPQEHGTAPSYEQKQTAIQKNKNRLCLVVSPEGFGDSVKIFSPIRMYAALLEPGQMIEFQSNAKGVWLQIAYGRLNVNGQELASGDGLGLTTNDLKQTIQIKGLETAELVLIELLD